MEINMQRRAKKKSNAAPVSPAPLAQMILCIFLSIVQILHTLFAFPLLRHFTDAQSVFYGNWQKNMGTTHKNNCYQQCVTRARAVLTFLRRLNHLCEHIKKRLIKTDFQDLPCFRPVPWYVRDGSALWKEHHLFNFTMHQDNGDTYTNTFIACAHGRLYIYIHIYVCYSNEITPMW